MGPSVGGSTGRDGADEHGSRGHAGVWAGTQDSGNETPSSFEHHDRFESRIHRDAALNSRNCCSP